MLGCKSKGQCSLLPKPPQRNPASLAQRTFSETWSSKMKQKMNIMRFCDVARSFRFPLSLLLVISCGTTSASLYASAPHRAHLGKENSICYGPGSLHELLRKWHPHILLASMGLQVRSPTFQQVSLVPRQRIDQSFFLFHNSRCWKKYHREACVKKV